MARSTHNEAADSLDNSPTQGPSGQQLYRALAEAMPALVLTTSADGEVEYCNQVLMDYCGVALDDLRGARWVELIHPDDVQQGREKWLGQIQQLRPFTTEYRIRRHDGAYRWHHTQTAPLRVPETGKLAGWVSVSVDVHDRREAEDDVRQMSEDLRKAVAAKDDFLALVSHELRTPVTTIYGNAQVLRRRGDQLPPDQLLAAIADIEEEAIRLQQLIDNMFILARTDDVQHAENEPVSLQRVIDRAIAEIEREPVVAVFDSTDRLPVAGNSGWILHILRNLLVNARAQSGTRGRIIITVSNHDENSVAIRVCDEGEGFGDDVDRVFDTFYRSPALRHTRGAGIGLPVAQRLVEAQGGTIWARNREHGGAEVGFTLPIEAEERA